MFSMTGRTWKVCHSKCGKELTMKEAYNTTAFCRHVEICATKFVCQCKAIAGQQTLMDMFKKVNECIGPNGGGRQRVATPCDGLDETSDMRIGTYITRTGAHGGGARSIHFTSQLLYNKEYHNLTSAEKKKV